MAHKRFLFGMLFFIALCATAFVSISPLYAQTVISVDTFADVIDSNGDCSLREAIIAANNNLPTDGCPAGGGDALILLAAGTYTLTISGQGEEASLIGDLDITSPQTVTIQGAGITTTTVDGNALDRIFDVRSLEARVTITGMTIQNGRVATGQGSGAIKNLGILTLTNTIIQNNVVEGELSSDIGGAICNGCGMGMGVLLLSHSIVRNNVADRAGGIFSNAIMTITNSSIISNSARAGGGILNFALTGNGITLINSTVSSNTASNNGGGIAQNGGTFDITNSTISNNASPLGAGIIHNTGETIVRNTIVAGNLLSANCDEPIISQGHNLSDDNSCGFTATSDISESDALLSPLGDYGGLTPTQKPSFLSPAINAGDNSQCPAIDQRGVTRPQGTTCDIGAYEYDAQPLRVHLPSTGKQEP